LVKVYFAKVSKNNLPYNIATLHYLPEDPKNLHRTLVERITKLSRIRNLHADAKPLGVRDVIARDLGLL